MGKVLVEESALQAIASAIRAVNGGDETYKPGQMGPAIQTIMEAVTYLLVDEGGNEYPAVLVDEPVTVDATANDIRLGTTALTAEGVTPGTKVIPSYHTTEGSELIEAGATFSIPFLNDRYDFTRLQVIICPFVDSMSKSVSAEKVSMDEKVYAVGSDVVIATVTRDSETKSINLGITNESDKPYALKYFTYREEP